MYALTLIAVRQTTFFLRLFLIIILPQRYQLSKNGMMNLFKRRLMNLGGWTDISEDGSIFQISCTDAHNLTIHIASASVSYLNVIRSVSLLC